MNEMVTHQLKMVADNHKTHHSVSCLCICYFTLNSKFNKIFHFSLSNVTKIFPQYLRDENAPLLPWDLILSSHCSASRQHVSLQAHDSNQDIEKSCWKNFHIQKRHLCWSPRALVQLLSLLSVFVTKILPPSGRNVGICNCISEGISLRTIKSKFHTALY